ncbi:hypothetical protein CN138_14115 [Sinorhizobium meliloti]|nr:hypothetical protein CDO27_04600 [Sinorhizobium meliloti]MQW21206.1 hypothetical protein [Sinorhizobium meliloti]QGJ74594.1 hypothetical protein C3L21_11700 [Sinorhizobium meliloti]RMI22536.1 hypothetical protein DA102_008750 [Sinorhizobium meliloti]RVH05386.1 hypothetical protein CN210_14300 [Sinorhizobium meliloti]
MHYRPEIDGLRAVAVIPVLLFHAGFISGGFAGVGARSVRGTFARDLRSRKACFRERQRRPGGAHAHSLWSPKIG